MSFSGLPEFNIWPNVQRNNTVLRTFIVIAFEAQQTTTFLVIAS